MIEIYYCNTEDPGTFYDLKLNSDEFQFLKIFAERVREGRGTAVFPLGKMVKDILKQAAEDYVLRVAWDGFSGDETYEFTLHLSNEGPSFGKGTAYAKRVVEYGCRDFEVSRPAERLSP